MDCVKHAEILLLSSERIVPLISSHIIRAVFQMKGRIIPPGWAQFVHLVTARFTELAAVPQRELEDGAGKGASAPIE
jgi:hypothetical protein